MTRLSVWLVPEGFTWRPGQHCFLRFPGLEAWGNHPFTIASADLDSRSVSNKSCGNHASTLTFYIRTHRGFTRKLAAYATRFPEASSEVWVEGPYGGLSYRVENVYDSVVLVAGGGGVTACLPWVEHLVSMRKCREEMRVRSVSLVWIVREAAHLSWVAERLHELEDVVGGGGEFLEVRLFVTSSEHAVGEVYNQGEREKGMVQGM